MKLLVDFRKWQLDATCSTGMFGIAGILLESPMQSGEVQILVPYTLLPLNDE